MAKSGMKRKLSIEKQTASLEAHRQTLDIHYFLPSEGLDQTTMDEFADYTQKMKQNFEKMMHKLSDENFHMKQRIAVYEKQTAIEDCNPQELIRMAFLRVSGKQQLQLWDEVKIAFSEQNLQTIAEQEFSQIIDELSHHKIIKATTRINNESK